MFSLTFKDICHGRKDNYQYSNEENCQSFWECRGGYSVPQCCPTGEAFMEGKGCVKNGGFCRSRCPVGAGEIQPVIWQGNGSFIVLFSTWKFCQLQFTFYLSMMDDYCK